MDRQQHDRYWDNSADFVSGSLPSVDLRDLTHAGRAESLVIRSSSPLYPGSHWTVNQYGLSPNAGRRPGPIYQAPRFLSPAASPDKPPRTSTSSHNRWSQKQSETPPQMKRHWLCERPRLSKHTAQSRGTSPKTRAIKGLKGSSIWPRPIPLPPSVSLRLPKSVCHIYRCCRLLVRPQLIIQTQISTTCPRILSPVSRPLTSQLSNTARLCGSAPGR